MSTTKSSKPIPTFDLQTHHEKVEVPKEFDLRDLAKKYSVFPLKVIQMNGRRRLLLAMRNPYDNNAILDVEFRAAMPVVSVLANEGDIQWLIHTHYYGRKIAPTPSMSDPTIVFQDVFEQLETSIKEANESKTGFKPFGDSN